jgi:ParB family transcriptional regulator, chromosome partitioning protein
LLGVKRKEIKADAPIPCILDTEHNGTESSLAENAVRCDIHPADQYKAFAKLHHEEGVRAEDIASGFRSRVPLASPIRVLREPSLRCRSNDLK